VAIAEPARSLGSAKSGRSSAAQRRRVGSRRGNRLPGRFPVDWNSPHRSRSQVGKAALCKSVMRAFDSHRDLKFVPWSGRAAWCRHQRRILADPRKWVRVQLLTAPPFPIDDPRGVDLGFAQAVCRRVQRVSRTMDTKLNWSSTSLSMKRKPVRSRSCPPGPFVYPVRIPVFHAGEDGSIPSRATNFISLSSSSG
jgi:hypothetical protein